MTVLGGFPDATPIDTDIAAVVDCIALLEASTVLDRPALTVEGNFASDEIMDAIAKELPGSIVLNAEVAVPTTWTLA